MTRNSSKNAVVLGVGLLLSVGLVLMCSIESNVSSAKTGVLLPGPPTSKKVQNGSSLIWNFQKTEFSVPNGQLHLSLTDLSSSTDYIVGVNCTDDEKPTLIAGEIKFKDSQAKSLRFVSQIVDLPRDQIAVQPGNILISGLSQVKDAVLIYLTVTPGTEVRIDSPNGTLIQTTPAKGLVLHNGLTVNEETVGIHTLVSRLVRPNPAQNTVEIVKLQDGRYIATPKGLAKNLLRLTKPFYPAGLTVTGIEEVSLRITIDETGVVKQINRIKGNDEFLNAAEQAVNQWEFRPFSADGKSIPVEATVVFWFGKDKTVRSPILTEMAK